MKKTKEWKRLEGLCQEYMQLKGILFLHLTTHITRKIGKQFFNFAIPGMKDWPDFIIFNKVSLCGMAGSYLKNEGYPDSPVLFVECKTGAGKLTKGQKELKFQIEERGFQYFVVRTFEEFKELINERS